MIENPDELMHELRSPMAAILAHADGLLDNWQGRPEEAERLVAIRIQAQRLLRFLGNQELGGSERLEPLAPAHELVRLFQGSAGKRRLTLDCVADGALPEWVQVDATAVRLILTNLLGNALKFTNEGGVHILVSAKDGRIIYRVADTGLGMDADQLARVRMDSVQVHASSQARGGQGLGLAAARRLARRAKGTLVIDSLPGQGTSVSLDLPIADIGPLGPAPEPRATLPEALLVHLDDTARLAIAAALKGAGYSVTATENPAEAAQRTRRAHAAGRDFRAVFIAAACAHDTALMAALMGNRLVAVGSGPLPTTCQAQVSSTPTRDELLAAIG